jgi:hypothetical protein
MEGIPMSTSTAHLHAYGYPGEVEEHVTVREFHRAQCNLCEWEGDEHDEFSWQAAEEEAIEHFQDHHREVREEDCAKCGDTFDIEEGKEYDARVDGPVCASCEAVLDNETEEAE